MYARLFKRFLDLATAVAGIIILSPLLAITWVMLILQNRGPALFIQERPGLSAKPFRIVKFKTMNDKRDAAGNLLPDVQRITFVGKIIRKLSIDELPQLINVLKGEMSLVGPRPLLFKYLPLYSSEQSRRHDVRPGITGWAQVNGRNAISWQRRFELDVYYVDNVSFWFDCKIIFMTIVKVLKREGINQSKARPMQPFTGNN